MKVTGIHIYPIKSGRGLSVQSAFACPRGFDCDRRWMVVGEDGRFITQREVPALAKLRASIDGVLRWGDDHLQMTASPRRMAATVWGDTVEALDMGDDVAIWLSAHLGRPARIVCMDHEARRWVEHEGGRTQVSFADGYPYLLATEASLEGLNGRLDAPVPMSRFRPNIVVDGDSPFSEDAWRWIRIGDVRFEVVSRCARCTVTTVDQDLGARLNKEPLKTLSTFRRGEEGVYFGMNLIARDRGLVRVNDPIEVLE